MGLIYFLEGRHFQCLRSCLRNAHYYILAVYDLTSRTETIYLLFPLCHKRPTCGAGCCGLLNQTPQKGREKCPEFFFFWFIDLVILLTSSEIACSVDSPLRKPNWYLEKKFCFRRKEIIRLETSFSIILERQLSKLTGL